MINFIRLWKKEMRYAPKALAAVKVRSVSTESAVSNEGIFDAFIKFIKGYNKDSPDDNKEGKKILSFNWVKEQENEILKTFGNSGWVKSNYHENPTQFPENFASKLSYKGKVLLPAEGLEKGLELVRNFIASVRPAIEKYSKALNDLEDNALKRIKGGEDSVKVAKDTLAKVKLLKLPFNAQLYNDNFVGGKPISAKKAPIQKGGEIPKLSLEDVISGGAKLAKVTKEVSDLFDLPVLAGSGCDTDLWGYPGFDYNHEDKQLAALSENLYFYFYFQEIPDEQIHPQYEAIFNYAEYAREVGRWLKSYTR